MTSALDHVESAIRENGKALSLVKRSGAVQVRTEPERDNLKATALAWLQTHRSGINGVDLDALNAIYQQLLNCTAKSAARSTYVRLLKEAKSELVRVRGEVASAKASPSAHRLDSRPPFAKLTADDAMLAILDRRWDEIQRCISVGANLSATVMMGGLLESLLLARINSESDKKKIYGSPNTPKDKQGKPLPLSEWKLVAMVSVGHDVGWISKSAKDVGNVLREFRNYIHPHKEHTDGVALTNDDVSMFWEVTKAVVRQLLSSAS